MRGKSPVLLTDSELETLRDAVMSVVLAPAADLAASRPADAGAAAEVRQAADLLSRIGWPGEAGTSGEISTGDVPDARRAMLIWMSGALERAWETATTALDELPDWSGLHAALGEVEWAGVVLRRLGDAETAGGPVTHAPAGDGAPRHVPNDARWNGYFETAPEHAAG